MTRSNRDGLATGLAMGVVIAFAFAWVIGLMPEAWFVELWPRAVLYATQVPASLAFVLVAIWVARFRRESPRQVLLWACAGALAFDGVALGFWPTLYGHAGAALTGVATLLLWAFAWIAVAALLVAPHGDVASDEAGARAAA